FLLITRFCEISNACAESRVLADCNLYFFKYYVQIAITTVAVSDKFHHFFISVDLLSVGLEMNYASKTIKNICQMNQHSGNVPFLDGRVQIFFLPAAHAINEISIVIAGAMPTGSGFHFLAQPTLVRVVVAHGHVALGAIEEIPD